MLFGTPDQQITMQIRQLLTSGIEPVYLYIDKDSYEQVVTDHKLFVVVVAQWGNAHIVVSHKPLSPAELGQ
jgi:hypothetical protein